MAGLAFAFFPSARTPLVFRFPLPADSERGVLRNPRYRWVPPPHATTFALRNPRYRWVPPPQATTFTLRNPRYRIPPTPFPGELLPKNVRAGGVGSGFQSAVQFGGAPLRLAWQPAALATQSTTARWQPAASLALSTRLPWGEPALGRPALRLPVGVSALQTSALRLKHTAAQLRTTATQGGWDQARPFAVAVTLLWHYAPVRRGELRASGREALPLGQWLRSAEASARLISRLWRFPWRAARPLGGVSWPWPPLPPLPPLPPRAALRFHFHPPVFAPLRFHFGQAPAWVLPILRSYRMVHDIAVVRLPDRAAIPVTALTMTSAWDEWAWSFSATLAGAEAVDLLRPIVITPVEIEVTVDGNVWQFRLDQVSGSAEFGKTGGQTRGRGRAALLGPDVALPANGYETDAKTARQLAEQELTGTNWQLDWPLDFPDWLVPARTFSYSQKTPIEVISQIVETAGGRIQADPALDWIQVTPRYPAAPWQWSALQPDIILPRSIMTTLAWKPRLGQPWDAVYLGDGASVLAKVVRTGLPGVSLPDSPTIEPLLCHLDACRARGIALLSDAIAGVDFTLALPLSSVSGPSPLRAVGELARFEDGGKTWVGLITAVTIQVGFGTAAQTLDVRAIEVAS